MSEHDQEPVDDFIEEDESLDELEHAPEESEPEAEDTEPESEPEPLVMMPPIESEDPNPEPTETDLPSKVITGRRAVDPARARAMGPLKIPVGIYCGIAGLRPPSDAGFKMWAQLNGHAMHTREEWAVLFADYRNTKVES